MSIFENFQYQKPKLFQYFTRNSISNLADKVPLYDEVELEKTITSADITAVRN